MIWSRPAPEDISIHALLAESDQTKTKANEDRYKFLSTLSLRRATVKISENLTDRKNFYPRSPCGERQPTSKRINRNITFLSTLSLRRATQLKPPIKSHGKISIHALLAESDQLNRPPPLTSRTISIHALLAESDDASKDVIKTTSNFYPRSPCGERRRFRASLSAVVTISIHALLAESDTHR